MLVGKAAWGAGGQAIASRQHQKQTSTSVRSYTFTVLEFFPHVMLHNKYTHKPVTHLDDDLTSVRFFSKHNLHHFIEDI